MTKIVHNKVGENLFELGVEQAVLYKPDNTGLYKGGVAWNGMVTITQSPSGAEASPQYADNRKYINLVSPEEHNFTIEAFMYPDEFAECDGVARPRPGVRLGQQIRKTFGLTYRTLVGNDVDQEAHGFKQHLVYGALAKPSEKAYATMNESPEPATLSWECSTTPVTVGEVDGVFFKPTAIVTIDSTDPDCDPADLQALMDQLYGTAAIQPNMPLPADVLELFPAATAGGDGS